MLRFLGWLALWLLTLGILDIEAEYSDGLKIHFVGWPKKLAELLKSS